MAACVCPFTETRHQRATVTVDHLVARTRHDIADRRPRSMRIGAQRRPPPRRAVTFVTVSAIRPHSPSWRTTRAVHRPPVAHGCWPRPTSNSSKVSPTSSRPFAMLSTMHTAAYASTELLGQRCTRPRSSCPRRRRPWRRNRISAGVSNRGPDRLHVHAAVDDRRGRRVTPRVANPRPPRSRRNRGREWPRACRRTRDGVTHGREEVVGQHDGADGPVAAADSRSRRSPAPGRSRGAASAARLAAWSTRWAGRDRSGPCRPSTTSAPRVAHDDRFVAQRPPSARRRRAPGRRPRHRCRR